MPLQIHGAAASPALTKWRAGPGPALFSPCWLQPAKLTSQKIWSFRSVGEGLDGACSRLLFATSQNLFFQVLYCFYALFFLLSMLLFFLYCFLTWARASSAEMTFNMDETDRSFIQRLWAPSAQHTSTSIALFEGDGGSAEWRSTLAIYVSGWASSGRGGGLAFLNRVAGKAPPGWRSDEGGGQHHLWDIGGFLIPF